MDNGYVLGEQLGWGRREGRCNHSAQKEIKKWDGLSINLSFTQMEKKMKSTSVISVVCMNLASPFLLKLNFLLILITILTRLFIYFLV